jgi:glycosyltransferase involved in cell wall biosynthesis
VPDDTWLKTAALVEGTCFWTGYERIGSPIVDLGTRNFRRVMAAVACADLVVTVDTGPMHVASALKKPILAIQQAFDLSLRLPKGGNWTSFSPDLDCLKCCEFHCPINKDNPPCTFLDHELLAKAINLRTSNAIIPEQKPVVIAPGVPVPPEAVVPKLAKIVHYVVVVLTVFKRHQHIDAAIKSIRNAGFTEAIVITAGGITPELEEVLKRHEATGVIVVRNAEGTTNTDQWIAGCKYAQRRLVILFHDDDLMLPGYADALFPLLTGEAEYSISNAAGHGSPTAGPSDIAILKPGVSNSRMLEDTLMRLERTLSPIQGCFPRDLVISSLEEWKTKHSDDKRFEAWPGFEVGNDLYLWLKASSSLKKCLVLSKRYVSCNHHAGSATAANIAAGTRQFETMYDLVRKIHKPRGIPRYRAICYVHDWSIASGFLRNLSENGGTGIVDFLTDCNTAPGGLISFKIPKIGPFLNPVNVKDISAFVAFIRGIEHARDHRLDWFFWVETDCRFNGANWLPKLWQENLAWPHDHVCSGTPVVWNLPMNGVAQAKTWMPYFAEYTAKTGRLAAMEGWRHGPQSAYPNGALAWYRTETMLEWFKEPLAMKRVEMQEWCSNNTAFDWFVGRQMVTHYGLNAPRMMGFLSSSYSGCGDHFYTAEDRRKMLRDGIAAIHQEKDNSL